MEFVVKGTVVSVGHKAEKRGWFFRDMVIESGKDRFRIVFWNEFADLPITYNPGDEVEVACEFRSEQKLSSANQVYYAMRINGWGIKAVFKGVYVSDYLRKPENQSGGISHLDQVPI